MAKGHLKKGNTPAQAGSSASGSGSAKLPTKRGAPESSSEEEGSDLSEGESEKDKRPRRDDHSSRVEKVLEALLQGQKQQRTAN